MLLRRLKYPFTTGLILRRTQPALYKSHVIKLFEEFPTTKHWWNEQRKEMVFPNGSRLFFGSAEHSKDLAGFDSADFADIMPDESQEFSQNELERLSVTNRCTSNPDIIPKMVYTFMPGTSADGGTPPIGLPYLKRVFVEQNLRGDEHEHKWAFLQAFSWDNIEWARKELGFRKVDGRWEVGPDGVSEKEFYKWPEERRREFFIKETKYGKNLASLSNQSLRDAWLYGKWDAFQGQYFQNFSFNTHTFAPGEIKLEKWYKRWISGDWGDDHPACFHWHAMDENDCVITYRELWGREMGERFMGEEIGKLSAGENISAFFLSADAFGKINKRNRKPVIELISKALPKLFPRPTPVDQSPGTRVPGWRLMDQLLDSQLWKISRDCEKLIECIPTLVRDMERNTEDVLKVDYSTNFIGDDAADAARYGLISMLGKNRKPDEEEQRELHDAIDDKIERIRKRRVN